MAAYLKRDGKPDLAYVQTKAQEQGAHLPTVVFLAGFRSDMEGTKATFLEERCKDRGQAYIRFDYSGHGISKGAFEDGTISQWTDDSLAILDQIAASNSILLVGSSMGGWISLLCALKRPDQICGLVGLAAAPDFSTDMKNKMTEEQRTLMESQGYIDVPNAYSDEPYKITKNLIEDGDKNCLLKGGIGIDIAVRLIQGMKDDDVEWQHAHRIKNAITGDDVEVLLIEDADHRLSRPQDLEIIDKTVIELSS